MCALPARADEPGDWAQIETLKSELSQDPPAGQNSVEYETPIEAKIYAASGKFVQDYPASPHHWDAALLELKTVFFPAPADERRAIFRDQEQKAAAILQAPDAPDNVRADAERTVLRQHLDHLDLVTTPAEATGLAARLTAFVERHPDDPKIGPLQLRRVDLLAKAEPAQGRRLLDTLASNPNPSVATAAKGRLAREDLSTSPLDWTFMDVRGNAFDARSLRGKVLLVDFWATWCPDCMRELPRVIEAYQKYHDQGLEIVGVSLDKKREALTSFIQKRNLPWPQYFDGQGWDNALAVRYGVRGIPEMWLVDKTGRVVATGLHGDDLDHRIGSLLNP